MEALSSPVMAQRNSGPKGTKVSNNIQKVFTGMLEAGNRTKIRKTMVKTGIRQTSRNGLESLAEPWIIIRQMVSEAVRYM